MQNWWVPPSVCNPEKYIEIADDPVPTVENNSSVAAIILDDLLRILVWGGSLRSSPANYRFAGSIWCHRMWPNNDRNFVIPRITIVGTNCDFAFHPRRSDSCQLANFLTIVSFPAKTCLLFDEMLSVRDSSGLSECTNHWYFPSAINYEVYSVQISAHGRQTAFLITVWLLSVFDRR